MYFNQSGALKAGGSATLVKLPMQEYKVTLNTSDVRGADSDGVVMLRLVGDKGETSDLRMSVDESVRGSNSRPPSLPPSRPPLFSCRR